MTWWKKGIRFECQGSGNCCVSRGQYGYVYFTKEDRKRMAKHLGLKTDVFTKNYCEKSDGFFHLKEEEGNPNCRFLKDNRCSVYEGRPTQCRTWPFWPEVMSAKSWKKEVASFCPGVGKGRVVSENEIKDQLELQKKADVSA